MIRSYPDHGELRAHRRVVDCRRPRDEREPFVHRLDGRTLIVDADVMAPLVCDREDLVGALRRAGAL